MHPVLVLMPLFVLLAALLVGVVVVSRHFGTTTPEALSPPETPGAAAQPGPEGEAEARPVAAPGARRRKGAAGKKKAAHREARAAEREARAAAVSAQRRAAERNEQASARAEAAETERAAAAERTEERDAAARAAAEEAEYAKWRGSMEVGEAGAACDDEDGALTARFVEAVIAARVVDIDRLAADFELSIDDCLDRLRTLVANGSLTGVFDERGRFFHIASEEFSELRSFVESRGRVRLSDITAEANRVISGEPPETLVTEGDGATLDFDF
jgi:DDRGK domain-containing protein 1